MNWDCVYVWIGGRRRGEWMMIRPTSLSVTEVIADHNDAGFVALPGFEHLGPPTLPPRPASFDKVHGTKVDLATPQKHLERWVREALRSRHSFAWEAFPTMRWSTHGRLRAMLYELRRRKVTRAISEYMQSP